MFTLCTYQPVLTETLPIPKLCLTGRAPPRNTTVDFNHIDIPPNINTWATFHNGVAAGLRIANSSQVENFSLAYWLDHTEIIIIHHHSPQETKVLDSQIPLCNSFDFQIDSTWIIYNKPKSNELTNEHAGFLMGLGLNGHLSNLATLSIHDYLLKGHEMTSVGLLLGVAAGK